MSSQNSLTLEEIQNFSGKYPRQLWFLFFTEMWERFCFYGMRGVLAIFMVGQLGLTDREANLKYGAIQAFVYAFTFIGGIFADKILGFRKSLTFGGITMILGNLIIAFSPASLFYVGITLSIIGTGFFKPNISSMVGDLYKEGDSRRDAGFSLFYAGINIGALLGGALCVWLGKYHSWSYAFLSAAIVMLIGVLTFELTKKHLGPIGESPLLEQGTSARRKKETLVYLGTLLSLPLIYMMIINTDYTDYFMYIIGPAALIYFLYELFKYTGKATREKMIAALIFIVFSIIFWAFFEQSGGSLALFAAGNLHHSLMGIHIDPNVVNNSFNALFVIVLSPLIGLLWVWLSERKAEPNTVIKFGLGFLFLGLAFLVFYATVFFGDDQGMTSLNVFTGAYLVITIAELCLSPIGLSIITKLSPKKLGGMMMGMWFLASAYGQYVAGLLGAGMSTPNPDAPAGEKLMAYTDGYYQLGIYAFIAGVLLIILSPLVRKLMHEVK
jgi:POT family proton-dependent oligopeptide transporter